MEDSMDLQMEVPPPPTKGIIQVNGITKIGIFNDAFEDIDFDENKDGPDTLYGTSIRKQSVLSPLYESIIHKATGHVKDIESGEDVKTDHSPMGTLKTTVSETNNNDIKLNGHVLLKDSSPIGDHTFVEETNTEPPLKGILKDACSKDNDIKANGHLAVIDTSMSEKTNGEVKRPDSPLKGILKNKNNSKVNGHLSFEEPSLREHSFAELFDLDLSSEDSSGGLYDLETGQLTGVSGHGPNLSAHQLALLASPLRKIKGSNIGNSMRTRNAFHLSNDYISWHNIRKTPHRRRPGNFLLVAFLLVLIVVVVASVVIPIMWVKESRSSSEASLDNSTLSQNIDNSTFSLLPPSVK